MAHSNFFPFVAGLAVGALAVVCLKTEKGKALQEEALQKAGDLLDVVDKKLENLEKKEEEAE